MTTEAQFYPPNRWRGTQFHWLVRDGEDANRAVALAVYDAHANRYTAVWGGVGEDPAEQARYGFRWFAPVPGHARCRTWADRVEAHEDAR